MKRSLKTKIFCCLLTLISIGGFSSSVLSMEVEKGKIAADQLLPSFKKLAWGCPIWDEHEAVAALQQDEKILWVDTRPESFFKAGSVRNAVVLPYNKQGQEGNTLTEESLKAALAEKGLDKDSTKISFFCQGPECHRSYNASFMAVTAWGYKPENIIWFRAGYPLLFKVVKEDGKLGRKAKKFLSDEGVKSM
jgi:hypothetical protein